MEWAERFQEISVRSECRTGAEFGAAAAVPTLRSNAPETRKVNWPLALGIGAGLLFGAPVLIRALHRDTTRVFRKSADEYEELFGQPATILRKAIREQEEKWGT
jgi:hypothetical protein